MSPISIGPKFFACITGVYVLGEISISDGAVGGAFIQQDPIWIDDVSFWRIFFVFFLVSSSCSGCDPTRALNVYDGHFTAFCPIYWQWYHMTSTNGLPLFPGNVFLMPAFLIWKTLPPWLVYVLGVMSPYSFHSTIRHRWRSGFWVNWPYTVEYCSSSHFIYLIIVHNFPTWGVTSPETS